MSKTRSTAPRPTKTVEQIRQELEGVSPLALPGLLRHYEVYDMEDSLRVLDRVYAEFGDPAQVREGIAIPLVTSLVEAGLRIHGKASPNAKKPPSWASQLVAEIKSFRYEDETAEAPPGTSPPYDARTLAPAARRPMSDPAYDRNKLEDGDKMQKYKEERFGGQNRVDDDFGRGRPLRQSKAAVAADHRIRSDNQAKYVATTEHLVPLKRLHETSVDFRYIDDEQQKRVANTRANFAVIDQSTNSEKREATVGEYIRKKGIGGKQALLMRAQDAKARVATTGLMAWEGSKTVAVEKLAKTQEGIGDLLIVVLVPFGYEIYDITKNGLCPPMNTRNPVEALSKRLARLTKYCIKKSAKAIAGILDDLLGMLLHLAVALLKEVLGRLFELVRDGIGIFVQAIKVLCTPSSKLSAGQKGDALVKLASGAVFAIAGEKLGAMALEALGVPPFLSDLLAIAISAVAGSIFIYVIDKIDLFSLKSERRLARIREIFDARLANIRESTRNFEVAATETLKAQRLHFEEMRAGLNEALDRQDFELLNTHLDQIAAFFKVDIPYDSPEAFARYVRDQETVLIG